jgi:hypothetical protein
VFLLRLGYYQQNLRMATVGADTQDKIKLYKFTKILTLKVAQIVVQSRQGKKITQECNNTKGLEHLPPSPPTNLQWVSVVPFSYKMNKHVF